MKLYNTLSRKIEELKPLRDNHINLFVCGPTVYDLSHIGHAKTYTQFDVLARTLRAVGYEVTYLQNITDIDDKIIARATERNIDWQDLRAQYETEYMQDMQSLGNTSVTTFARATDHIDDIIRQVQTLLDKGHAYIIEDGIYFEIATFADYGKLSGRQEVQKDDSQTRIDHSDEKKGWNDFCLWKFSKPGEPVWDAPFGKGRPGWHIEDTAITEHFFGPQYDIHGGAVDLIFPHHEAEITQMEAASGKTPFVHTWMHAGFLNIDNAKMSKSLGNFFTIREVIEKGYNPMAIRLLMLQTHYRGAINFTWENLDAAQNRLQGYKAVADLRFQPVAGAATINFESYKQQITEVLSDDLNTPKALTILSELTGVLESNNLSSESVSNFSELLEWLDQVLGLQLSSSSDITPELKQQIKDRESARTEKDWAKSDQLRDKLAEQGIAVRDTAQGTIWSRT